MQALIPPYLEKNDSIGIFAPSRGVTPGQMAPFISFIQKAGFKCITGKHLYGKSKQFSGTIAERRSDIQQLLLDHDVKAMFAARGGYGAAQLLSRLDWEVIRDNPKWLVGFSDLTALHSAFGKYTESIHGVMPYSLVMDPPQSEMSFDKLLAVLRGEALHYSIQDHDFNFPGTVRAVLTGGNLSVLFSLAGTAYEPDYEGKILFLEDLDEYLYHIDRMLLNFEQRGIFEKISGLIVGGFSEMHDNDISFGKSAYEILAEKASKYNIPSLFGFPAGHQKHNFPLIFGRLSTLRSEKGHCFLEMY